MLDPRQRQRWRTALAVLATSIAATVITAAGDTAGAAPWTATATTDAAAPGMLRVAWPASVAEQDGSYRVRWWAGASTVGAPAGSVVLDNPNGRDTPTHAVAIPSLVDGQLYTVSVAVVNGSGQTITTAAVASATVHGTTATCPMALTVCGVLPVVGGAAPVVTVFSGSTSASAMLGMGGFGWSVPGQWPHVDNAATGAWVDVRISIADPHAAITSHWWSMAGDDGSTFESATTLLVPTGGSVSVGQLTNPTGTVIGGTLRKLGPDGSVAALTDADFKDLCVYVMRDIGADQDPEFGALVCGYGHGFGSDAGVPGTWRLAVPAGTYRLRFIDRPNYFGVQNVLLYDVNFAAQWWRADGSRGERYEADPLHPFAGASPVIVGGSAITDLDAVLRPAAQMSVTVTDIPVEHADSHLLGDISVTDEFGNWTGGALTIDTSSRTATAAVTGLVSGRSYKIFLRFRTDNSAFTRWWLVGGGTPEDATGIVPGPTVVEAWQPAPIVVTLHRPDGSPYGAGQACLYVRDVTDTVHGHVGAASCTDQYGIVRLQQLRPGTYRVAADGAGAPILLPDLHVPTDVLHDSLAVPGYVYGYHDVSRLDANASIPSPYVADAAIVVP